MRFKQFLNIVFSIGLLIVLFLLSATKIGVIARHKDDYAIGINLSQKDFLDKNTLSDKLIYLASRHTRYTNKKVKLFVGVPALNFKDAKKLIQTFDEEVRKNISLFQITDDTLPSIRKNKKDSTALFS